MFDHKYPYTNFHEMNLDWIIAEIKKIRGEMTDFEIVNKIKFGGSWDSTKSYSIYTVVIVDGIGYVALQNVPAGIMFDNTEYWLEIGAVTPESLGLITEVDYLTGRVSDLVDDISDIKSDITDVNNDITSMQSDISSLNDAVDDISIDHATYHVSIYVAAVTGDDDNDGLTSNTPVKNLKRALDIMNKKSAGVYIRFIEAGTYVMSYPVISGAMIHFMFDASNVTLNWLDENDTGWTKCFYACYINMHGNVDGTGHLYIRGSNPAYIEGGKLTISNLTIESDANGAFGVIGSAIQSANNTWKTHLYITLSQAAFHNDIFVDESSYYPSAIHAYNGADVTFRGGVTFKDIDNNDAITSLISVTTATVRVLQDIILDNTTLSSHPIYAATAQFLGGENRLGTWLAVCDMDRVVINNRYFTSLSAFTPQ